MSNYTLVLITLTTFQLKNDIPIQHSAQKARAGHSLNVKLGIAVADLELEPPLDLNYFIFMGNFKRFCVKLGNEPHFPAFEPLPQNPGSAPDPQYLAI